MYVPSLFLEDNREFTLKLMREHPLASVITHERELMVNLLPTLVEEASDGLSIKFHLARTNPQAAELEAGIASTILYTGPNCYVSPSWYAEHPNVPTWNYVTVQASGAIEALTPAELELLLDEFSSVHEANVNGTWSYAELPSDYKERMLGAILGFRLRVARLESKAKLSQNRPEAERRRIMHQLLASDAEASRSVGEWMRARFDP